MTPLVSHELLSANIEWIYFDIDDTLWNHTAARDHAVASICEVLALDPVQFKDHYKRETKIIIQEILEGRMDVATSRIVRMKNILHVMGHRADAEDVERIAQQYLDVYIAYEGTMRHACEVIAAASRFAKVGLLTNAAHATQDAKIAQLGGPQLFDIIVTTDETNEILKPDARFFEYADRLAGNPDPERVLMVGDDWRHDIRGACDRGYWSVWITSNPEFPEPCERVFTIPEIGGMLPILEAMAGKDQGISNTFDGRARRRFAK